MQDLHDYSTTECDGGGGGSTVRFFGGGIGSGDRRMREHKNNKLDHHQSLKCPRCNSLNTKFCYYNNYNLSQPRHFCKNCRRYWTKGGVLRNVPVGGGCRKAKRSRNKQPPPMSLPSSTDKPTSQDVEEKSSSSESSSLTASNSTVADVSVSATATVVAGSEVASSVIPGFLGTDIPNLKLHGNGIEWSTLLGQGSSDGGVFLEIGGFTAASSIETTPFEFGDNSVHQDNHMKLEGETIQQQFEDRMAQVEFPGSSLDPNMGFEPLDWGSGANDGGDQTLFDLTSTGDHAYWSQSQWTSTSDQDQNGFYLP